MADSITTYDSKGQKLSFRDTIANVFPIDTPIHSAAKNGKATAKLHQWQEEVLDTPGQNAAVEGVDKADEAQTLTTELSSYTQVFEKLAKVTDSNEAIGKYGRAKELARQEMLKGKALTNDIEYAYAHSQAGSAGTTSAARAMKSLLNQLDSSVTVDASAGTAGLTEARMVIKRVMTLVAILRCSLSLLARVRLLLHGLLQLLVTLALVFVTLVRVKSWRTVLNCW